MLWSSGKFLDADVEDWHVDCWNWLLRCAGGLEQFKKSSLALPIKEHFAATDLEGHAKAQHIFDIVRQYCGMTDWPVKLVAQHETAGRVATFGVVQNPDGVAGTYSQNGDVVEISYDPADIDNPVNLIATFAHELGHYLNGSFQEAPPGGWDLVEPATDVTAAFFGFGVFGANSAFHFTQTQDFESQGWDTAKRGYLTEAEWTFSIAIYCALADQSVEIAMPHIKKHLAKQLHKAAKYIEKSNILNQVTEGL